MWQAILFSMFAGLLTIFGIILVKMWHATVLRYSHYVNSFAAGFILTTAVSVLLPDGLEKSEQAPLYAMGGFTAFLLLGTFLVMHSGAEVHYARPPRSAARGYLQLQALPSISQPLT